MVDAMPPALRECVHEFGLPIVYTLRKFGITQPKVIREIVRECWAGPRQAGQRSGARGTLEVVLSRCDSIPNAATLYRILADNNLAIVSTEPTGPMVEASMAAVKPTDGLMGKTEKHRRRLRAAIAAGAAS